MKRFFSSMLLSGGVTALDVLDEPSTEADHTKLHIVLTGDAGQHVAGEEGSSQPADHRHQGQQQPVDHWRFAGV